MLVPKTVASLVSKLWQGPSVCGKDSFCNVAVGEIVVDGCVQLAAD